MMAIACPQQPPLYLVIPFWYVMGVVSISSSKQLLSMVSPLTLTLQQLFCGVLLTRLMLLRRKQSIGCDVPKASIAKAGLAFSVGFYCTNCAFSGTVVSMVETIKAAEPITSTAIATLSGLERFPTIMQCFSLIVIVAGVVLAVVAQASSSTHSSEEESTSSTTTTDEWRTCAIVLAANVCFGLRGLFQKQVTVESVELQYRMQSIGFVTLFLPWILAHQIQIDNNDELFKTTNNEPTNSDTWRTYLFWTVLNGFAFATYNLASTYTLSRLSVIHHACVNALRRVFAIISTCWLFGVPLTLRSLAGIVMAISGFLLYVKLKQQIPVTAQTAIELQSVEHLLQTHQETDDEG